MQSDNVVLSSKIYFQYFILLKLKKEELKMSPSVQCLSVRMPRCSFQPILTGTNHLPCYASLQAGMGSIPSGIDPFNSDLAGLPPSLLCYSLLYIQYICSNIAIVFNYLSINDNHCVAFTFYYFIFKYYSHVFTSLSTSGLQ